jgi:hypothetical protein
MSRYLQLWTVAPRRPVGQHLHDFKFVCGLTKLKPAVLQELTRVVTAPWPKFCWSANTVNVGV